MTKRRRKRLRNVLATGNVCDVYNSFDIVVDLAITKVPRGSQVNATFLAKEIMRRHRNVKAVFTQTAPVEGNYRLRRLTNVAGESRTRTIHKESGCMFSVDIEKCYFFT